MGMIGRRKSWLDEGERGNISRQNSPGEGEGKGNAQEVVVSRVNGEV